MVTVWVRNRQGRGGRKERVTGDNFKRSITYMKIA
jgi:hypothetical protein